MRHLAIDYGTKRIGLAMSDAGGTLSEAFDVVPNTGLGERGGVEAARRIAKIVTDEGVDRLVVGLPLNMDGTASWMTRAAVAFGAMVAAACLPPVPLIYVDERLSSFEAEEGLKERQRGGARLSRQDKKSRLDALAAAHFLREYLEGRLTAVHDADVQRFAAGK